MVKCFLKKNLITLLGVASGGVGGFLYWYFVGCVSGTCPIAASPLNSTLWGMLLGGLLFNMFQENPKKGHLKEPEK